MSSFRFNIFFPYSKGADNFKQSMVAWMRLFSRPALLILCLMLVGCSDEVLYSDLNEADANEMMGLLLARNIQAEKQPLKEEKFAVAVPRSQFAAATDLLRWYGIPREKFSGIGDVFKKTGIVSSPSEERIRFMYALSQEITETLSHIDGVITARVTLVLPKNDPYTDTTVPSSASVFLKFRPGLDTATMIPQIKTLVMKSVEGLSYDNVSVVIMQSESIDYYYPLQVAAAHDNVFGITVPKDSVEKIWALIIICCVMALFGIAGLGAGAYILYRRRFPKPEQPAVTEEVANLSSQKL